ncbi:hypothetical protein [Brucella pituitosa]|uniref:hypothetical protein n=1 Tax=Brucella pituitosa TaxID=571256 RepID=UPI001053565F
MTTPLPTRLSIKVTTKDPDEGNDKTTGRVELADSPEMLSPFEEPQAPQEAPQNTIENHAIINPVDAAQFAQQQGGNNRQFPFCVFIAASGHQRTLIPRHLNH